MKPSSTSRRHFLKDAIAAGLAPSAVAAATSAAAKVSPDQSVSAGLSMIDTNAYVHSWPFRHLPLAEPRSLAAKFATLGVKEAWVGSMDALFHRDLGSVNSRLAEDCASHTSLKPIGAVNPTLPKWEEDVERCANRHHMKGIRLHPNYHGYKLDDPRFVEVLKLAAAKKLFVQIAAVMEDERTQYPLLQVPAVDIVPLPKALESVPEARVMLLNWQRAMGGKPAVQWLKATKVVFDIAMLEGIAGIATLLEELPLERVLYGSYAPVFYPEAAKLKLQECALNEQQLTAITHDNASRFIAT